MIQAPEPLLVEIVAYAPTAFYHCTHCEVIWQQTGFSAGVHEEQVRSALPPDLMNDYQTVSDWVRHLMEVHGPRVAIRVIDAASLPGVWKTARHGLRRYPAVLVGGRRFEASDFAGAEQEIERRVTGTAPAGQSGRRAAGAEGGGPTE
jgi:hypothetical protein